MAVRHVILVSIDGLRPDVYLDERWPAPAMRSLVQRGAHVRAVRTIFPSLTYACHTTMATGVLPARHGVWTNRLIAPLDDPPWICEASRIRVPALWDVVPSTAALNWPMTKGAAIPWNLPDIWPGSDDQVVQAKADASTPGLFGELEREATGRLAPGNFSTRLLVHDLKLGAMAAYLFERYRPALTLVHLESVVQLFQEAGAGNPRRAQAVATADVVVAQLMELLDRLKGWDDTAIVVTGDHGMTEVHTAVRVNRWLMEAGLRGKTLEGEGWRATFHALGGCALLRVASPEDAAQVRRVLQSRPPAERATFRIVERGELDALGSDPEAPFALAAAPGFVLDQRMEPPDLQPNPGMSHGHHPEMRDMDTGLILAGAGVRAGAAAPRMELTDLAPLVGRLLGMEFGECSMTGLLA